MNRQNSTTSASTSYVLRIVPLNVTRVCWSYELFPRRLDVLRFAGYAELLLGMLIFVIGRLSPLYVSAITLQGSSSLLLSSLELSDTQSL